MTDNQETNILICSPQAWGEMEDQIRGTIISSCSKCNAPIYVSPSGQSALFESDFVVVCVPCGLRKIESETRKGNLPNFGVVLGQLEEVQQYISENELKRML